MDRPHQLWHAGPTRRVQLYATKPCASVGSRRPAVGQRDRARVDDGAACRVGQVGGRVDAGQLGGLQQGIEQGGEPLDQGLVGAVAIDDQSPVVPGDPFIQDILSRGKVLYKAEAA